ncbi:Uncharacterized protein APZ42_019045 [Daphnia magna]|uniref:Uncharacterized protein n=1 Tax=Daphnia magna TaxID=35525 RepID=A0A164YKS6_9CRUS|nr:Uncharacterized protein APZ42_019045 [Daphnia magna]
MNQFLLTCIETDRTGHLVKTVQNTGDTTKINILTSTESAEDLQTDKQVANGNNGGIKSEFDMSDAPRDSGTNPRPISRQKEASSSCPGTTVVRFWLPFLAGLASQLCVHSISSSLGR